eukprot:gene20171-biopygen28977
MRAVGIAEDVLQPAADGNFDHLPEPKIMNLFRMDTIGGGDPAGPIEHFRSTGIRDGPVPNPARYNVFASAARNGRFTLQDVERAVRSFNFEGPPGLTGNMGTNDVNEDKRPAGCTGGKHPTDAGHLLAWHRRPAARTYYTEVQDLGDETVSRPAKVIFIVTLNVGGEVQAGLKSLVPASSQVEVEGFDASDISENELSSDASEEEDELVETSKISEDDWREVQVTTCHEIAPEYSEPGPGRLRHVELLDVDPASAPLMVLGLKIFLSLSSYPRKLCLT